MKKLLLIVSALVLTVSVGAQTKEVVLKNLDKAKATVENPKKATAPASWLKLAEAYVDAYNQPQIGLWVGAQSMEVKLLLKGQQVLSTETRTVNGNEYTVEVYADKELYYTPQGVLDVIKVTAPLVEEPLESAYESLMKAYEVDVKASKKEDIAMQLSKLRDLYINDAMTAYTLGDIETANKYFESSLKVLDNPVTEKIDSMIVYYTAVTFNMLGDKENAAKYLEKCMEIKYYQDGDVFSNLAEVYKAQGDLDKAKAVLNEGFIAYPTSQGILVSLINIYLESNDDPNKVLELIRTAQANEPNNASLHYAEGNVYKNMKDMENAIKCYYKSFEIDPTYVYGIYTVGSTYYDRAIEIQEEINNLDVNDYETYDKLLAEFEQALIDAIDPFEKAFAVTTDKEFQLAIADGLKQIYFRFRDKDPKYQEGFDKYNAFLEENDK
ncbi:MAG: tetratricopeptide repeat protein [Bacteroidales bacterium]|nr:tetratricopeptide repeat protein [Bacteroidales bacterium]MBO7764548.1 tetratricopeptide repeat protein [Bacteroidales bacterium]MBQ2244054.1 tetratricopeptide repeat protein [Bacteroidales bacterium]